MFWPVNKKNGRRFLLLLFLTIFFTADYGLAIEGDWKEKKGQHFIIYYPSELESSWASDVLSKAERYYDRIASQIGYSRYQNYWTWDNRVKIYVFSDQETFTKITKQPSWTRGFVVRDFSFLHSRYLVTYKQEEDFLNGVLPHEISHLILSDFIGREKSIPNWLDEGIAQYQEEDKKYKAQALMRALVAQDQYIPLKVLFQANIQGEKDPEKVLVFYAQSISLIDFFMKKYGSSRFGQLCNEMRSGKNFSEALKSAYTTRIDSIEELENKWLKYMKLK